MEGSDKISSYLQGEAAKFLSQLLSGFRISQAAANFVVEGFNNLNNVFLDFLKAKASETLATRDGYLTICQFTSLLSSMKDQSLFEGIQNVKSLTTYITDKSSNKPVLMKQVCLKKKTVWRRGIPHQVNEDVGYYVPFLPQLEQLLNCKDVLFCVDNPLPKVDGVFRSVTDGLFYKYHKVVQENGDGVLAIMIYVDDVEVCDPLKSKAKKYNLRLFYWVLLNIHPNKRSTLKAINLLAIVRTRVAKKYGNSYFLRSFIDDMKKLSKGVVFNINGVLRVLFGILLCVCGDAPALANLGGFKESHFALRPCRNCMVKNSDLCKDFHEPVDLLRRKEDHDKQVSFVMNHDKAEEVVEEENIFADDEETETMDVDNDANANEHPNPSVNYGINSRTILSEAPEFDETKCLLHDNLHVLAEGVVELLCRLLLKDVCFARDPKNPTRLARNRLQLKDVNKIIEEVCDFGHMHRSKPSQIEKGHVFNKLKQSGSQMIILAHVLPFILLDKCPENKQDLLIQLLAIVNIVMSFEVTESDLKSLQTRVEKFGRDFTTVYPNIKTLKLHYLVHLVMQGRLFGPWRQHACYRFESMHTEFTQLVPVIKTKKDIALSLGKRYMLKRNTEILAGKEGSFLYSGDKITQLGSISLSAVPEKQCLLDNFLTLEETSEIKTARSVSKHGSEWVKGSVIKLKNDLFGIITTIYLVDDDVVLVYKELDTYFISSVNAFEVCRAKEDLKCISLKMLPHPFPIAKFTFNFPQAAKTYLVRMSPSSQF